MKPSLRPGTSLRRRIVIDAERTIGFMGDAGRVYATPSMILDIEETCRELILVHADEGEDSVGIEVSIRHFAATLPGMSVEIDVKVASVEGRKVTFDVAVEDELEPIGGGTHARFVVDTTKTVERLKAKAAQYDLLKTR